jgi:Carboxypeptidase regulatory-like domain
MEKVFRSFSRAFLVGSILLLHSIPGYPQTTAEASAAPGSALASAAIAQQTPAPAPQTGTLIGTVTDVNDDLVLGATVALEGPSPADHQSVETNDSGFFKLDHLNPGITYHVTVSARGFADWTSPEVILKPGQYMELTGIRLSIAAAVTTVKAVVSTEEIATEQERVEEQQRVLGFIPNFYVVYDHDAVPLTTKLKFRLAFKTMSDPITILGSALVAGVDQATDTYNYGQGWDAYAQRFGANYANGLTEIVIGGAILPSILHQDPRYFYQGTGTTKSRIRHALINPFICRGDNGRQQFNYSSLGGYLASGAIANAYYPASDRGVGLVFSTAGVEIGADMASSILQEFVLRKLTPSAKNRPQLTAGNN